MKVKNCYTTIIMKLLYLGSFFPDSRLEEILSNSKGVIQNAGDTYQKAILTGLSHHIEKFDIITSPMLGSFPNRYKKYFFKSSNFKFNGNDSTCLAFNNITLFKVFSRYWFAKKQLKKWVKNNVGEKHIIVFSLDSSLLKTVYEIKNKFPDIKVCLIVTDLFRFMVVPESIISKSIMQYFERKSLKYIEKIDSFVLLTKYMKDDLLLGNRPFVVVEGIYSNDKSSDSPVYEKEQNKTILYSGTLAKQYGIINLLDAFSSIDKENYRLWICGEGNAKEEILKRAEKDHRIKYFGQLRREEVVILQKKATVLINPRLSDSEFTLYSFPSKTMEYLASGTPIIMHPLKCLSEEYLNHIFIAKDESDAGLMKTIIDVCERKQEDLNEFGRKASEFVKTSKNPSVQVAKIIKIINNEK